MRFRCLVAFAILFSSVDLVGFCDEPCHFHAATVSPDERRILALTGTRPEWKCDYQLIPLTGGSNAFVVFVELYTGMDCVGRYHLADVVTDPSKPLTGHISLGWKDASHQLTGVVDCGPFFNWPWTDGAVTLPQFSPSPGEHFFETSLPELRHGSYGDCMVFPVLGIRGDSMLKAAFMGISNVPDFLKRCVQSRSKNALVVYVYKGDGDPPLAFTKSR